MKKLLLSLLSASSLLLAGQSFAATYKIDPAHSQVNFKIKHLGISSVSGRFDTFEGTFEFDPKKVETSHVQASIDVLSIDTNQGKRDTHLKSCDFFCTEKFPKMSFVSKAIKVTGENAFQATGELTIHGVTKPVTLDVEYGGEAVGPDGKNRAAFTANAVLNRKDFGLTWSKLTEAGGVLVGDEVKVYLEIEATKEN